MAHLQRLRIQIVRTGSLIHHLLKTQTEVPQKRSRHLWSGLLSAVSVVPQCDSWECHSVMETNRVGRGGYDIFPLSPPVTTVYVWWVGDNKWLSTGAEKTHCSDVITHTHTHTTRCTHLHPQGSCPCATCLGSRLVMTILIIKQDLANPLLWQTLVLSAYSCKLRSTNIF